MPGHKPDLNPFSWMEKLRDKWVDFSIFSLEICKTSIKVVKKFRSLNKKWLMSIYCLFYLERTNFTTPSKPLGQVTITTELSFCCRFNGSSSNLCVCLGPRSGHWNHSLKWKEPRGKEVDCTPILKDKITHRPLISLLLCSIHFPKKFERSRHIYMCQLSPDKSWRISKDDQIFGSGEFSSGFHVPILYFFYFLCSLYSEETGKTRSGFVQYSVYRGLWSPSWTVQPCTPDLVGTNPDVFLSSVPRKRVCEWVRPQLLVTSIFSVRTSSFSE